jgi:ATP-binding cassette, subfamily B, bacterial CvaB/MchF/RaxB
VADGITPGENNAGEAREVLQFGYGRRLPMLFQAEAAECGLASLAMIGIYYGHDVDLASLRRRFSTSLKGVTLSRLMKMANGLGFTCRPLRLELEHLPSLKLPCVLHWDMNHFVVLKSVGRNGVVIHDPGHGIRKLSMKDVSGHFTGVALELTPSIEFKPVSERRPISLKALTGHMQGIVPALAQILLLALALEIFGLLAPFYVQRVLDQVVPQRNHDLLMLLAMAFLVVAVFTALIAAARSWAVMWLGAHLNVQWTGNLFAHLMKLPLEWFEKRHVGDVVSRFGSIQSIQRTLTTQFVGSLLDGLMSVATLMVMTSYSAKLTLLVLGLFGIYTLARWGFFEPLRRTSEQQIVYAARQQSQLLESIRGAMSIKLANKQEERCFRYTNATVASANRDIATQRLNITFSLGNQLLFGIGRVVMVWIAATLVLDNKLSIGMLVAFIAYADQFISRGAGLIDKYIEFRMLRLHGERIADIALAEKEANLDIGRIDIPELQPSIELRNVSFCYGEGEPWILKNYNLRIDAGESVAIVGPSGCGKSTLAKIVLGLLQPTHGEVLFGGVDIRKLGLGVYRQQLGAVMQDDQLFAGSIMDNISFFEADATYESVETVARLADIHSDIMAMPMGYQSLIGDMGSSLSGGQKQRVLLARALFRRPRLLVLDEATSHLDVERERHVNEAIKALNMTRIIIAHRPETMASAGRVEDMTRANPRAAS